MINKYSKRSDKVVSNLAKLSKAETKIVMIEKKTGMPGKFNVPSVKVPSIKCKSYFADRITLRR